MGRKFTFAYVIVAIQTVLLILKIIPVDAYQAIIITAILGVLGANAAQKITQPKEYSINIDPNQLAGAIGAESDDAGYSPDNPAGFRI